MTKSACILQAIGDSRDGLRFGEIQRKICEMNGLNYDSVETSWGSRGTSGRRRYRGYWCDHLLGWRHYPPRQGLLYKFCIKGPDGRWRLKFKVGKSEEENG